MPLRALLTHAYDDPSASALARDGGSAFVSPSLRAYLIAALAVTCGLAARAEQIGVFLDANYVAAVIKPLAAKDAPVIFGCAAIWLPLCSGLLSLSRDEGPRAISSLSRRRNHGHAESRLLSPGRCS